MQPPLVVHIIYALGTGGLENGLVNIINRAPADRYRHAIVCLTSADEFASRITAPGVEVIELHKKPGHDLGVYRRLWQVLRSLRPSIVHTRNLNSLEMQLLVALLPGVKRIHGEHGRDIHDLDGSNRKYNLLRRVIRPFIHRYITVSKDLADWLKAVVHVPQTRIRQIYNGVDTARFYPVNKSVERQIPSGLPDNFRAGSMERAVVIGAVGRIAQVKNQRSLISAVDLLVRRRPELAEQLKVILVGNGPLHQTLKSQVDELGLADTVWMPGDRTDIPDLLRQMDVFVLPSLAEGVSNTVLEAMASGLPVIATRVGGNTELIQHEGNGLLVDVNEDGQLAEAIAQLVDQPELREQMGRRGLERVREKFDWNKTVESYLAVYDEVL